MKNQNDKSADEVMARQRQEMGRSPDLTAAIHALIEALDCPERDGPFQAAIDRAKAAMKGV